MSIGSDVKKAFEDVGISFTIKRDSGNFSGEYLVYDIPAESKDPFDREVVLTGNLSYDTIVIEGDILELSDGRKVLVAHKTPDMFQDAVVDYETTFFKCNIPSGEIFRSSGEVWDAQEYHKVQVWDSIKSGVNGVLIEVSGNQLSDQDELGLLSISRLGVYLPSGEDLRVLDRIQIRSGEYYKVDVIKKSIYPSIIVAEISEDIR